jgi:predicted nucleic acid-binding protein
MRCVIDSSFAAAWFLPDEATAVGQRVFDAYEAGALAFEVPDLMAYEMANLFLLAFRRKRLDAAGLQEARDIFDQIRFEYHNQTDALCRRRLFRFAEKHGLTAYDAACLELADRLQLPLLTQDEALLAAARKENLETSVNLTK